MYGCAIGRKFVRDMDNNFITPACFDKRAGIGTIENFAKRLEITIGMYLHITHF
jgi:hypothetical protein